MILKFGKRVVLAAASVIVVATGVLALMRLSQGEAQAMPYSTSDQIRAARPLGAQEALIIDLTFAGVAADPVEKRARATLAQTFNHLEMDGTHQLDDYGLCRMLSWPDGGGVMNMNCHAIPFFAFNELQNRLALTKMIASATSQKPAVEAAPYWSEAGLGVAPQDAKPLQIRAAAGGVQYLLGPQAAGSISGDLGALSPAEARAFSRFLARHFPMHPQMRADIAGRARLPMVIEVMQTNPAGQVAAQRMTLANLRREKAEYPLPGGLPSALRAQVAGDASPRGQALRRALAVVDSGGKDRPPSFESLMDGVRKGGEPPLASLMLFLNVTQQYGGRITADRAALESIRPQIQAFMRDPQAGRFLAANNLAGNPAAPGDRVAAARFLAEADALDKAPFGTFRYVTYANLAANSEGSAQWPADIRAKMPMRLEDNYWRHIAAYPWASNTYADLANLFPFDPQTAWLLQDLGRAVDTDWKSGVMGRAAAYEARLRTAAPDFY